ncbi:hypothetical protein ACQY1Q_08735 [Tenacibaculum sp. TC6]|uniref:hypothetical protein n=1 Tax=Tenacibaculum sp. TC6 TaxID=3423223 RepID=UPI003D360290
MELDFEIDFIFKKVTRHSPHLIARLLSEEHFQLSESSTFGGFEIKGVSMPRATDDKGNPRFDIFAIYFKDKTKRENFNKGQIVQLIP